MNSRLLRLHHLLIGIGLWLLGPAATLCSAHPGHYHLVVPADQPVHWLVEPEHAVCWLLMLWTVRELKRTTVRNRHLKSIRS